MRLLYSVKKYDLILIEYELFPYFPSVFEYLLNKRGIKYIVDYDDAIFHKYDMSRNVWVKGLLKNKIAKVMQHAEHVVVCNAYLESYAKKYNEHTFRLPTVVLLDKYKKEMENFKEEEKKDFVIGWIGSKTTSIYILEILPAIAKFIGTYANVRFDLVGFDRNLLSSEELARHRLNVIAWKEEQEIKHILNFDIGIMPLHDDPWSRGKCGFKLVQYMSCKKPVIASPVGMNCSLVKEGENGFLVSSLDGWFDAFEKLYLDEELRSTMSQNNFQKIEKEFNHEMNCERYSQLIKTLVNV
ncbi:glycosyltransferase [Sulfurovum sp.]|uniref:glycosyltransferase n=1 Tax=Sulfurovum sp. TaxID=1969726 RepID=UPI002867C033|nr:glycosyltransferase [Sulfurovum sp.]